MTISETELIEQSKIGDFWAFEQLIYRYDKEVLTIVARFTKNSDDAKDIYQETFIRVFKGLNTFQFKSEFSTWLYRIAMNVCLSHKEKKKRTATVSIDDDGDETIEKYLVSSDQTDARIEGNEITDRIESALHSLSPKQKMVFTLRHYQDYKLKEIAAMMNCAEGTVKKYLFEATQKMRIHLHDLYK